MESTIYYISFKYKQRKEGGERPSTLNLLAFLLPLSTSHFVSRTSSKPIYRASNARVCPVCVYVHFH